MVCVKKKRRWKLVNFAIESLVFQNRLLKVAHPISDIKFFLVSMSLLGGKKL